MVGELRSYCFTSGIKVDLSSLLFILICGDGLYDYVQSGTCTYRGAGAQSQKRAVCVHAMRTQKINSGLNNTICRLIDHMIIILRCNSAIQLQFLKSNETLVYY